MSNKNKFSRRKFLTVSGLGITGLMLAGKKTVQAKSDKKPMEMLIYIGTYTSNSTSEGIYIYKLNLDSGAMTPFKIVKGVTEPSFLTIDKDRRYLYAVNETEEYEGKKSGAVSAFAIDRNSGDLQFLNKQASLGGAPCHVSVSDNEKFVLVANYVGGNVSVFPIQADGRLGASVSFIQHTGTGPNKDRQEAAHAHSINLDRKNHFAAVCDLGMDKVMIYQFDEKTGKLQTNPKQPFYQTKPGAGPRHLTFHPNGKFAFLINEMGSSVTSLAYDEKDGVLKEIQTLSTLPGGIAVADNTCAEVFISPNGKFLYGSNRGHDSISSYKIDETTGQLAYVENILTGGKTPRNFVIDPTGAFLLAAHQNSDSIVVFRVDKETGKLQPTGNSVTVPKPVCLKIIPNF